MSAVAKLFLLAKSTQSQRQPFMTEQYDQPMNLNATLPAAQFLSLYVVAQKTVGRHLYLIRQRNACIVRDGKVFTSLFSAWDILIVTTKQKILLDHIKLPKSKSARDKNWLVKAQAEPSRPKLLIAGKERQKGVTGSEHHPGSSHLSDPLVHLERGDRRRSRGDPHHAVGSVHAVGQQAKGHEGPKVLNPLAHLMEHHHECH
eukprot:scaffold647819_cov38-Prasinocladus_malaysianus.AAC.2